MDPSKATSTGTCRVCQKTLLEASKEREEELNDSSEELYMTIKIMASGNEDKGSRYSIGPQPTLPKL